MTDPNDRTGVASARRLTAHYRRNDVPFNGETLYAGWLTEARRRHRTWLLMIRERGRRGQP